MKKVSVIGCGAYMDTGYGCPGEWRCLKAAALGEGEFDEPVQVIHFLRCQCPGRNTVANLGMATNIGGVKPDAVYLSSCLAHSKPGCPYFTAEELAAMIENKTGVKVIVGTHDYH